MVICIVNDAPPSGQMIEGSVGIRLNVSIPHGGFGRLHGSNINSHCCSDSVSAEKDRKALQGNLPTTTYNS